MKSKKEEILLGRYNLGLITRRQQTNQYGGRCYTNNQAVSFKKLNVGVGICPTGQDVG